MRTAVHELRVPYKVNLILQKVTHSLGLPNSFPYRLSWVYMTKILRYFIKEIVDSLPK